MAEKKKRWTIGLLVSGITEHYIISICKGVIHAAKEADVNLVVLPGKYIDRDLSSNKEIRYEYQYNTLFEYAAADTLDAVIVAADVIGCFTSKDKIGKMLEKYRGIPCVLISSKFPGYVSVNSDNDKGIQEAVEYLALNKKCEKFGMIGGPEDNTDAGERRTAFLQALKNHNLTFEDSNFVVSDLSKYDKNATVSFLDQNPQVQAVFCVNDDVAVTLYEEMERRNLIPGKDILVFGYDNSTIASKVNPTLSSIWTDKNELGEQALQTVIRMIHKEKVESLVLPSKFVMRESTGGRKLHLNEPQGERKSLIAYYTDSVFYNARYEELEEVLDNKRKFAELLGMLFSLADKEEDLYEKYSMILEYADKIQLEFVDVGNLLGVYEELCSYICHRYQTIEKKDEIHQLFELLYRKIIHAMNHQLGIQQGKQEKDNYLFKLFVSNTMQFEKGTDQSYTRLISDVDFLGIKNAGIYLFEEPVTYLEKDVFERPDFLYLKAVLQDGKVTAVPSNRQKIRIQDIFHFEMIAKGRFSNVCLPLFSNEILYGVLICNLSAPLFDNGEFLVNQMGSAAKMIDLLRLNGKIQQKLEESLVALRENNIELDNLSKSDALTGIMNRRGFYTVAEKKIVQLKQEKKKILFAYIDMNNLKIINDRYGHDEGDFSLKLIGQILTDHVNDFGVTGRIGGDEYACVLGYGTEDDGQAFVQRICQAFDAFNQSSNKEYNVTVSVGTYVMEPDDSMSLKDALSHADESLYEAKKHRIKSVAKITE